MSLAKKLLPATFLILSACSPIPLETSYVPVDTSNWKVGYAYDDGFLGKGTLIELVTNDESVNSWSQLLTIQFMEGVTESVSSYYQKYKTTLTKKAKNNLECQTTSFNTIEQSKNSIIYEWLTNGCLGENDQHEIAKLMKGNDGLHRVAYVKKGDEMPNQERNHWIDVLRNSYVEKDLQRVVVK